MDLCELVNASMLAVSLILDSCMFNRGLLLLILSKVVDGSTNWQCVRAMSTQSRPSTARATVVGRLPRCKSLKFSKLGDR